MNKLRSWLHLFKLRFRFAYRHSFRSNLGIGDFCECWGMSKEIYCNPEYWGE